MDYEENNIDNEIKDETGSMSNSEEISSSEKITNEQKQFENTNYNEPNFILNNEPEVIRREVIKENKEKKEKKPMSKGVKIAIGIVAALLLGALAAFAFFGVKSLFFSSNSSNNNSSEEEVSRGNISVSEIEVNDSNSSSSFDISGLIEEVMPSLVSITNVSIQETQNYFNFFGYGSSGGQQEVTSAGSGIIIGQTDDELLIVTNAHVVDGAQTLTVTFFDEESYEANVKGQDSDVDVAVIAVKNSEIKDSTLSSIKIAKFGDSDALKIGNQVISIGNAGGIGMSATTGIVSALNRKVSTSTALLIQTDAAINPGSSGGALFNTKGEIIGINSSKFVSEEVESMCFAIPSATVKPLADDFMTKKTRERVSEDEEGYLGITGQDVQLRIDSETTREGIYIKQITKGTGCDLAGVPVESIIVKFEKTSVNTMTELKTLLKYYAAGEKVTITCLVKEGDSYVEKDYDVVLSKASDFVTSGNDFDNGGNNGNGGSGSGNGFGNFFNFGY